MEIQNNLKKLKILKKVSISNWKVLIELVDSIVKNKTKVLEKSWTDQFKQDNPEHYPLDLSQLKTWSTFEDCVKFDFYIDNEKLYCDATVWDGNHFSGKKQEIRFKAKFELENEFILNITDSLKYFFDYYLDDLYLEYLDTKKATWKNKTKKNLLK